MQMGIQPSGFLGFVNEARPQLPVLSSFVRDATGSQWLPNAVPDRYQELIKAYGLLQYDILFGDQYSLGPLDGMAPQTLGGVQGPSPVRPRAGTP